MDDPQLHAGVVQRRPVNSSDDEVGVLRGQTIKCASNTNTWQSIRDAESIRGGSDNLFDDNDQGLIDNPLLHWRPSEVDVSRQMQCLSAAEASPATTDDRVSAKLDNSLATMGYTTRKTFS